MCNQYTNLIIELSLRQGASYPVTLVTWLKDKRINRKFIVTAKLIHLFMIMNTLLIMYALRIFIRMYISLLVMGQKAETTDIHNCVKQNLLILMVDLQFN